VRAGIRELGNLDAPQEDLLAAALCPVLKILGTDIRRITGEPSALRLEFDGAEAVVETGENAREELVVEGESGTIRAGRRWWRGAYFEIERPGVPDPERYASNYEGNGMKYLLKDFGDALRSGNRRPVTLSEAESERLSEILEVLGPTLEN
jgi:hypothetical protein